MDNKDLILCLPSGRKVDLRTSRAIRRELHRVYNDMRSGRLDTAIGTRLVWTLGEIRKAYEAAAVEQRERVVPGGYGGTGGVLLIPAYASEEAWEADTRAAQAKLINETQN